MDFTHISSWLELSMEGYLVAVCVYVEGQLATVDNDDVLLRTITPAFRDVLDTVDNLHSREHLSENDVLSVEPASHNCGDEKLRAIGILSSVCHGEKARSSMLELEVLIWESVTVDGLAPCTITASEVTTLNHEVFDDTVELGAFVAVINLSPILFDSRGQSTEVLYCLGNGATEEANYDATQILITVLDVEVNFVRDLRATGSLYGLGAE